jgi:disease resistance protein RPS2
MQIEIPKSGFIGNAIERAQLKLEERLIEDSNIRIIGVFGMGGVGKTSLLQTINNSLKVRNAFDPIIWVTVSKDYDILKLQDCIANRLNLQNFPDKSDLEGRKHRLSSYLRGKKFLLLLDDMWKSLELQTLGVPLKDRGSKIVLTTRIRDVCASMEADEITRVEPLSEEEGWQLFCSRAFRNGNVPQEIHSDVARKIAGECKGLPLAKRSCCRNEKQYLSTSVGACFTSDAKH